MTPTLWLLVLPAALFGLLFFAPWLRLHWHLALSRRAARRLDRVAGEVFGMDRLPAVEPTWYPPTPGPGHRPSHSDGRLPNPERLPGPSAAIPPPTAPRCGVELYGRVPCHQCRPSQPAIPEPPYDSAGLTDEERAAEAARSAP